MERSCISAFPAGWVARAAFALALAVGPGFAEASATQLDMQPLPSDEDYRACPGGQAWQRGYWTRVDREALRRPLSPPRDPALSRTVARLAYLIRQGYGQGPVSKQAQAAAADAMAAAAAAAGIEAGPQPGARRPLSAQQAQAAARQFRTIAQRRPMPDVAEIGVDGVAALWRGIQYDSGDPARQLRLAESFLETQRRTPGMSRQVASMAMAKVDGLRLDAGRPQRFGTRFEAVEGKVAARPLESERAAEAARREFDLMPFALEACLRKRLGNAEGFLPTL